MKQKKALRKIVICGSAKFIEDISRLAKALRFHKYNVVELYDVPYSSTYTPEEKIQNKYFYTQKIRESDLILVYDKNGYIGLSTAMEIQVALDHNIPVKLLFESDLIELNALLVADKYDVTLDNTWLKTE